MSNELQSIPVIFNSALEGIERTYRKRFTPELRREMAALGIDFDRLETAYDLETFERVMRHAGTALYPELPESERWRRIGREFVEGFVETTMGRAALTMGRLLGPRRTLERIVRTFRTGSNYLGAESNILGPTEVELRTWMLEPFLEPWRGRHTLQLDYRLGILEALMSLLGTRDAEVKLVEKDLVTQSVRYRIRWSP